MYVHLTDDELVCAKVKYGSGFKEKRMFCLNMGRARKVIGLQKNLFVKWTMQLRLLKSNTLRFRLMWLFDNSTSHNAYMADTLNASVMNAKPGGKQPCMKDTMWNWESSAYGFLYWDT